MVCKWLRFVLKFAASRSLLLRVGVGQREGENEFGVRNSEFGIKSGDGVVVGRP